MSTIHEFFIVWTAPDLAKHLADAKRELATVWADLRMALDQRAQLEHRLVHGEPYAAPLHVPMSARNILINELRLRRADDLCQHAAAMLEAMVREYTLAYELAGHNHAAFVEAIRQRDKAIARLNSAVLGLGPGHLQEGQTMADTESTGAAVASTGLEHQG